jgi:hypothetical protein
LSRQNTLLKNVPPLPDWIGKKVSWTLTNLAGLDEIVDVGDANNAAEAGHTF